MESSSRIDRDSRQVSAKIKEIMNLKNGRTLITMACRASPQFKLRLKPNLHLCWHALFAFQLLVTLKQIFLPTE
jgi:hypothetical protein